MYYPISVGLDVHQNSIVASAFDAETGEVMQNRFDGSDKEGLIKWITSFDGKARAVYESGFCGFALARSLDDADIPCTVAAISKLVKPAGDRVKTDKRDATFLARQLAVGNIVPVHIPSLEREGMRDLSRTQSIIRANLTAAKLRVMQTHNRYGLRPVSCKTKSAWTIDWLSWAISLKMPSLGAQLAYDTHIAEALRLIDEKKRIEVLISKWCDDDSIKYKVDAFSSIKGISKTAAFCLISEIGEFSRFSKGSGFSSYLGLVPSENSSGKVISRGGITRTGNNHVRKTLIESAWCYARMKTPHKTTPIGISPKISAMARKANTRLFDKRQKMAKCKRPCVVNAAIARELACCVWTIGVAVESEGSV